MKPTFNPAGQDPSWTATMLAKHGGKPDAADVRRAELKANLAAKASRKTPN